MFNVDICSVNTPKAGTARQNIENPDLTVPNEPVWAQLFATNYNVILLAVKCLNEYMQNQKKKVTFS